MFTTTGKRSKSLRGRLFALMAVIAIVECAVLLLSVSLSGVFTELDAEAFRFFQNDSAERALSLDGETGRLIRNTTNAANSISQTIQSLADEAGVDASRIYTDNNLYNEVAIQGSTQLVEFLRANSVSAAFFILDGSNTRPNVPDAHSAVYIRNSAPGVTDTEHRSFVLEVGPLDVAREHTISVGNRWALDMELEDAPYYENPVEACVEYPRSELVRYGYWSPPTVLLENTQASIAYTLPLLDQAGAPIGVMGFEISVSYFINEYLSVTNLPFNGSFFAVTSGSAQEIDVNWVIPGSPVADEYLQEDHPVVLQEVKGTDLYEAEIDNLGGVYCTVNELTMYSRNSPFADQSWLLVGVVERTVLNETSRRIMTTLLVNLATTLGVSFLAIFLLTYLSSRKIVGLSQYVNELGPGSDIRFVKTDLREIDDLTSALERLNQRINENLKVTSKMMELTQLPLGGFEISDDMDNVMLTEYIYKLLHLSPDEPVSKSDWKRIFAELTSHPADGYTDVYRYDASNMHMFRYGSILPATEGFAVRQPSIDGSDGEDLYQYAHHPEERQKWLRIIEAPTKNGKVGMILDATADIDECMRLAHELDYDALTHLYNRTAFKREAFKKINQQPNKVGAMIFSDLDNLKHINDTYGHQMGDKLITTAADMFREFVEYGGIVARISGDEFAIFLYGFETKDEIMKIVRRLYKGFKKRSFKSPDDKTQRISCSSGLAWYPDDSMDVADLLKLSDYAMYEAKHNKKGSLYEKGTFLEFNEESYMENEQKQKNPDDLTRLIDEKLFRFRYQPIVDLRAGRIYGYEVFMTPEIDRFQTPGEVIAAARAQSQLGPLESALVTKILQVTQNQLSIIGDRKIFINSIPSQRLSDREWEMIRTDYSQILPHVIMEVTEAENDDLETMLSKLRRLRKMDIPIAIDDFGQGYQNEVRIIAMQPTFIKLDLELIRNLHADPEKQRIVRDLVSFAHAQGVKVTAEGVEMESELETVASFDIDYAQGFLLGRPSFEFQSLSEPVQDMLDALKEEDDEDD